MKDAAKQAKEMLDKAAHLFDDRIVYDVLVSDERFPTTYIHGKIEDGNLTYQAYREFGKDTNRSIIQATKELTENLIDQYQSNNAPVVIN